jgi:hypothetical protein
LLIPKHSDSTPHHTFKRNAKGKYAHHAMKNNFFADSRYDNNYYYNRKKSFGLDHSFNEDLDGMDSPEEKFRERFLNESFRRSEKLLKLDNKQLQANRRRKLQSNLQIVRRQQLNKQKESISKRAIDQKWKKDRQLEEISYQLKDKNDEAIMLNKVSYWDNLLCFSSFI